MAAAASSTCTNDVVPAPLPAIGIMAAAHERIDGAAVVEGASGAIQRPVAQRHALDAGGLQHGALQLPEREHVELPGVGDVGAEVQRLPLGLRPAAPRRIHVRVALRDEAARAGGARRLDEVARALDADPPVGGELLDGVTGRELLGDIGELVDHDLGLLVGQEPAETLSVVHVCHDAAGAVVSKAPGALLRAAHADHVVAALDKQWDEPAPYHSGGAGHEDSSRQPPAPWGQRIRGVFPESE